MIRRILLASAGAMALAGPAFAADLAPPPVYVPPPPMWTGFYVGVNAGYEWSATQNVNIVSVPILSDPTGIVGGVSGLANGNVHVIGGGQAGYNYQFASSWVVGIEADIDGVASANGNGALATFGTVGGVLPVTTDLNASKTIDYLGTVRGRFGFLLLPSLLIYGDGGLAYGEFFMNADAVQGATNGFLGAGTRTINYTKVGWTAGGGLEWMVFPNWSVKLEYLYYDLGTVTSADALFALTPVSPVVGAYAASQNRTHLNGNIVRAGINYHFNWGAPAAVVAKY